MPPGRWQRTIPGFYAADSDETARAEWYRYLAEGAIAPDEGLPRDMWRLDVDVVVADLSTPEILAALGLPELRPGNETWKPFQDFGEDLSRDGWAGLVAPSAALSTGLTLCLFWPEGDLSGVTPIPAPVRWDEAPPPPRGMRT